MKIGINPLTASTAVTRGVLMTGVAVWALFGTTVTSAQSTPTAPPQSEANTADGEDIVVVGSRIRGTVATAALPVTIIDQKAIDATGAVSGDDLFRSIPQIGDVTFNASNNPQTSNAARGDVNSINLRSLGVGNTLVLLNGRRMVQHPSSQAGDGNVPVLGYNSNSLPVAGIERVEVLRDGAAAIYGTDAVAGVVNTVLRQRFDGVALDGRFTATQGTSRREYELTGTFGHNFAEKRGNVTLFLNYIRRTAQLASDQPYTATGDLRSYFANDPSFATSLVPDGRATQSPWANLTVVGGPGTIRRGTAALTSAAGAFHTQSLLNPGCLVAINADACYGTGARATATTLRNERYDTSIGTTVTGGVTRFNGFAAGNYELSDNVTLYGELGYYRATTAAVQPATINLNAIVVPASNYWNPFGPVTFANGQANPNRISGLTNVPVAGLPVRLTTYRFVDAGVQNIDVTNTQTRALLGLRGNIGRFEYDTAILYSEAEAIDRSDAIDMTRLQASLALSTPDAYNPFSGGCSATPSINDCSPSSATAINAIKFRLQRRTRTSLLLGDFRLSRPDLFALPGGDVGIAVGVEARRETQADERDPNVSGVNSFRDAVTGEVSLSNTAAVSPTPSTSGSRRVFSAYAELAVPLVSPAMDVPLIRRLEVQLAGRFENYSDFGSIAKPKIAAAWDLVDGLRLRGSYSLGFRAPNLEQTNLVAFSRLNTNAAAGIDYYRCEADLRARRITSFSACTRAIGYPIFISGNPGLKPETSTNWTAGVVFQPKFDNPRAGRLTVTIDYWSIRQTGIVGQFGAQNAIVLDYMLRLQGSSNPNVVRAAVTADDTPVFTGSGLAAAGAVTQIRDQFVNLLPQTVQGFDISVNYAVEDTGIGDFDVALNLARLTKFSRETPPSVQVLFDARTAGTINAATPLADATNLIEVRGRPKIRASAALTWTLGAFQSGSFVNYIGPIDDTNFLDANGTPYRVSGTTTANLYVQYRFPDGALKGTRLRVGARNLFDTQPPLTADGYLGSLYNPYGGQLYASLGVRF